MGVQLIRPIKVSWLSKELGLSFDGPDLEICAIAPLSAASPNCLTYTRAPLEPPLANVTLCCIGPAETRGKHYTTLHSSNPRLDFARALTVLKEKIGFANNSVDPVIHPSVKIGRNVVIEPGVSIDEDTIIYHNVVIGAGVRIGKRCLIKSGAVIGEEGFGMERDQNGVAVRVPHIGSVVLGNNVEIGSLTTVCKGTLGNTIIEDGVKIDDHVHVAHNCVIRENAFVIACAELSGSVEIGQRSWIAPNASVLQKAKIGSDVVVGLGAVVLRDLPDKVTAVGNPARILEKRSN